MTVTDPHPSVLATPPPDAAIRNPDAAANRMHPDTAARTPDAAIRTFHARRGRLGGRRLDALDRLWPRYGLAAPQTIGAPVEAATLFGRRAPLVLEIGSGMGDATVAMAAADSGRDYLAVEVHLAGIANLLHEVERAGLSNVRIVRGDAVRLLRDGLAPDSLDAIHIFFPDPWPKVRHHKRRLIQPAHVALLRSRLVPGGTVHCATDWAEYAGQMREILDADPGLVNAYPGFAPRPAHRPVTRFERRGLAAGRQIFDLIFRRVGQPGGREVLSRS